MVGSREDILERVFALLGTISGATSCSRNRKDWTAENLPAIILLDGDEDILEESVPTRLKTVRMTPAVMILRPQIFVILPQRDDATNNTLNGVFQPVGPELSFWRDAILSAVINDPVLAELLTTTGQIVYRGSATDMATGRTMWGQLQVSIDFHYVWIPPSA